MMCDIKILQYIIMIHFIFVQCVKYRMQIKQERSEYGLTINSVKFMQTPTEGDNDVVNASSPSM